MTIKQNFYVITGGPGVGKTALIDELSALGYTCVREAAREIIQQQVQEDGIAVPWKDTELYSRLMLEQSIFDYKALLHSQEVVFFDRGIPDTLAYNKLIELQTDELLHQDAINCRYNPTVFLLPPWKEIYSADNERRQDFEEVITTYHVMKRTYEELMYNIVEVPKLPVYERADFVVQHISCI